MVRILIAALVGGIALFVWQYATWMYLDIHHLDVEPVLAGEDAVIEALKDTERGIYWLPGMTQADQMDRESEGYKAWAEKHKKGPCGFLVINPEGGEPMSATILAIGGGIAFLIAFVVALILRGTALRTYIGRVCLCVGIGVVIALVMDVQNWNYMHFPDDWTRGNIIDHVGGMTVLGIVLGAIVRPSRPAFDQPTE